MRYKWRWQWGGSKEAVLVGNALWLVVGVVSTATLAVVDPGSHGHAIAAPARQIDRVIWLVPFALEFAIVMLVCVGAGCRWVRRHPPIRRVLEHSDDIRIAYKEDE